jgi:hypothetical protein
MSHHVVGVAQLVELLVVVQAVVGSSPIAHPSGRARKSHEDKTDLAHHVPSEHEVQTVNEAFASDTAVHQRETSGYPASLRKLARRRTRTAGASDPSTRAPSDDV